MVQRSAKRRKASKAERQEMNSNSRAPVRMKRLTLDLHESLHRAIKRNAAEDGVTMAEKLRDLLAKHYRSSEQT